MNKKIVKITKQSHAYRVCVNVYNGEILDFLNPELKLKDTEFAIKNKLIILLSELQRFKSVGTLVLEFKKIEMIMKPNIPLFILTQKQKQLSMKVVLMIYVF